MALRRFDLLLKSVCEEAQSKPAPFKNWRHARSTERASVGESVTVRLPTKERASIASLS